jgi:ABC-type uncharacterized transport system involved in gliding motility auxiliary subunit
MRHRRRPLLVTGEQANDAPKPETRMVVFGDSDFVTNGYLGIPGNRDLFLNAVNWLGAAGKPDLDTAEGSGRPSSLADRGSAKLISGSRF